jgi:hypothetical protein
VPILFDFCHVKLKMAFLVYLSLSGAQQILRLI